MLSWLQQIEFVHPYWFLAFLALPVLIYWHLQKIRKRQLYLQVSSIQAVKDLSTWRTKTYPFLPWLSLIAFVGLILALARPQLTLKEEEVNAEGVDIVMSMDVSLSMLSKDFEPDRLQVSKEVAKAFVDKRQFDRIGLVVFSGESYTQCPLTSDKIVLKGFLDDIEYGQLEDGTSIGMGLASAVNRLKESEAKSKVVILITDGYNESGSIQPMEAVEIAKALDVKVYTIGVGSRGRAMSPVGIRRNQEIIYRMREVQFDENLLRRMAMETGGQYYRAIDEEGLAAIYDEIDSLEKTEMEVTTFTRYSEEYRPFLIIALIAFFLEILLRMTAYRTIP